MKNSDETNETTTQTNENEGTNNNTTEVNIMNSNSETNDQINETPNTANEEVEMEHYVIVNGKKYSDLNQAMFDLDDIEEEAVEVDVYYKGKRCDSQIAERNPYSGNFVFTCYSIVRYTYCDYDSSEYEWAYNDDEDDIYRVFHRDGIILDYDSEEEAFDVLCSLEDEEGVAYALEPNLETYGEYLGEESASTIFTPDGRSFYCGPGDIDTHGEIAFIL
ncbi:hypothetical protein SAMN02910317_01971 [Ruminococcaceae bacterium FB2012]|nr:hypothetical protein SAMN02910317_01971 [Ruminococcaceae bacterium FB2012]